MQSQLEEERFTLKISSSNQNTRGAETILSAELYAGDKKVDPRGTTYIYEWFRSSNDGVPTYFATGKSILVKPGHIISKRNSFSVNVVVKGIKEKERAIEIPNLPML